MTEPFVPKIDPAKRFWSKVFKSSPTGCWYWLGAKSSGYGVFYLERDMMQAHHWSWIQKNGPIPKGLILDHIKCNTPACVNPDHLIPATLQENTRRYFRERETCKRGHLWIEENITKGIPGWTRRCKVCHRMREFARRRGMTLEEFLCQP